MIDNLFFCGCSLVYFFYDNHWFDDNKKKKQNEDVGKNFFRVFLMKRGLIQPFLLFLHENALLN